MFCITRYRISEEEEEEEINSENFQNWPKSEEKSRNPKNMPISDIIPIKNRKIVPLKKNTPKKKILLLSLIINKIQHSNNNTRTTTLEQQHSNNV